MSLRILRSMAMAMLLGSGVLAGPAAAGATSAPPSQATLTQVSVNRTGGITIAGTHDCGEAVSTFFGGTIPADVSVVAQIGWTATQPAGRKTVVEAGYTQMGFQWGCFNNNADGRHGPVCGRGSGGGPCPWMTSRDGSSPWWVYAANGKFVPGPIHIELHVDGFGSNGVVIVDGVPQPITVDVGIPPLAFDLKARRA